MSDTRVTNHRDTEMDSHEVINGVKRYNATCNSASLYDFRSEFEYITISRRVLDRELRRTIEETMLGDGQINELTLQCMTALDADALVELREKAAQVKFTFDTEIVREAWGPRFEN